MQRLILLLCATVLVLQSCSKRTTPTVTEPPKRNIAIEEIDFEVKLTCALASENVRLPV